MNSVQSIQQNQPVPWQIHRSTLESLDPIQKILAEAKVKAGTWVVIDG